MKCMTLSPNSKPTLGILSPGIDDSINISNKYPAKP